MKKEICEKFIKIGAINYFVENLEIGPDSETLIEFQSQSIRGLRA